MRSGEPAPGAIFLSKDISRDQPLLGLMDIKVERNAFGRQVDSFEADLDVPELKQATGTKDDYHAVFIRAPIIESVQGDAKVLASVPDGRIVAAQQGHLLATSFHPELTNDTRFHEYFFLADHASGRIKFYMSIRPLALFDPALLCYGFREEAIGLDTARTLTRGNPLGAVGLIAYVNPARHIYSAIVNGEEESVLGGIIHSRDETFAKLLYLLLLHN